MKKQEKDTILEERKVLFKKQRKERGFDDSETWSLEQTIAQFIVPRLKVYDEIANIIRSPKLKKQTKMFLKAMEHLSKIYWSSDPKIEKEINDGLDAFPKIFRTLWW